VGLAAMLVVERTGRRGAVRGQAVGFGGIPIGRARVRGAGERLRGVGVHRAGAAAVDSQHVLDR
jgi:hypothetical protein